MNLSRSDAVPTADELHAEIRAAAAEVVELLRAKNQAYGNSVADPLRVFSRAPVDEQIRVRLDDKLSRLARGAGAETEDVELDILGYLLIARGWRRWHDRIDTGGDVA